MQATIRTVVFTAAAGFALAGCQMGSGAKDGAQVSRAETSVRLVERDVEAPDVFKAEDQALWDGRPSLGGVWVASPEAVDPERVILRNTENGKFVIGALFRRERLNPGPTLQISSDAAGALGILAGQPTKLSVIALRREEVPDGPPVVAEAPILATAETVETTALAAVAGSAIDRAEAAAPAAKPTAPAAPVMTAAAVAGTAAPAPTPAKALATPAAAGRNLIQIGIFSVEANASRAAQTVEKAGIPARILREESQGKVFWRVLAGPAPDSPQRENMLLAVKEAGFTDAYYVSR